MVKRRYKAFSQAQALGATQGTRLPNPRIIVWSRRDLDQFWQVLAACQPIGQVLNAETGGSKQETPGSGIPEVSTDRKSFSETRDGCSAKLGT